jgi:hypothetical protein
MSSDGRLFSKTCRAGHLLSQHAYFVANGFGRQYRRCRLCHIQRNRRYKAWFRKRNLLWRHWG